MFLGIMKILFFLSLIMSSAGLMMMYNKYFWMIEINLSNFDLFEYKLYFFFDWISMIFLFIVLFISSMTFYFSENYMSSEFKTKKILFLCLTLMFVMSMLLMITSLNMFFILLGWDGLGLVSYLLVIFYQNEMSNYSGMITIMTNRLWDISLILTLFFFVNLGSLDLILINNMLSVEWEIVKLLFILGSFTKSAQFPFSSWLPLAMAAPTPISALVHSSTLVTAGVYLLFRLNFLFSYNNSLVMKNLFLLVLLTCLLSGVCALMEMDFKKVIALSTLSQLGVMMFSLFIGLDLLVFFHLVTHALFKALLFLCSGVFIYEFFHNQDVRCYLLISNSNILISSIFILASMSLMGFPFLSGFYSKDLILELFYSLNYNLFVLVIILLSTIFTSMYSLRLIYFGILLNFSEMKVLEYKSWNNIYNGLIIMSLIVIFLGSSFSWLIFEKFQLENLFLSIKLMNLILIYSAFKIFKKMLLYVDKFNKSNRMLLFVWFLSGLFFLTNFNNKLMGNMINRFNFSFNQFDLYWLENNFLLFLNNQFKNFFKLTGFYSSLFFKFSWKIFFLIFIFLNFF